MTDQIVSHIIAGVIYGIGLLIVFLITRKMIPLLESARLWFNTKSDLHKTQTIEILKKKAIKLGILHTEQMFVKPSKNTGLWNEIQVRQDARDKAIETACLYLEDRHVDPPIYREMVKEVEAGLAELKLELEAMRETTEKKSYEARQEAECEDVNSEDRKEDTP